MRACWFALPAVVCVLAHAPAADAQEVSAEQERRARLHYESGTAYFDTGDYESALDEFRAAHAESPHPELLYNIFLFEERIGNLAAAVQALEAFLATPEVPRRDVLERRLEHLRARAARGETRIEASEVERASPLQVSEPAVDPLVTERPEASVEPAQVAPSSPPQASGAPVVAIVGFAIAGVGLAGLGIAGGITLAEDARLDLCAPTCPEADVQTIAASAIAGDITAGIALAGAILGVVGLFLDTSPGASSERSVRLRGLGLEATF
jgi:hypothetical protein